MGSWYFLVNIDKQEILTFEKIATGLKLRELAGTAIASSMITYYLLINSGDRIAFVTPDDNEFTLFGDKYVWQDFENYKEVSVAIVQDLIDKEVYKDDGIIMIDEEDNLYERNLTNIWDPKFPWNK
ncbi:MAG: hypothetical protein ACO1PI_12175 [Bacteroidota bacterium]